MSVMTFAKREAFALGAGLLCFLWALIGWLTVIPNQDILADGIQAQSFLQDPRLFLAFPGQKHGGPLEYPATILAEFLAPGNYYANAVVRPFLAFATGFVVAKLFQSLFPQAKRWAFLAVIAVGPSIIHGLLGPEGNPVGVWWLQPNWDMAWLFVSSGALVLSVALPHLRQGLIAQGEPLRAGQSRPLLGLVAGLMMGLGLFAHPAIFLLWFPLTILVLLRSKVNVRTYVSGLVGIALGVIPAAISYVINARVNTWDPSHGAFIALDYYWTAGTAVLGLNGIPDYMGALLPYGLGLAPSQIFLSGTMQSILMWIFVVSMTASAIIGVTRSFRHRRPLSPATAIAVSWVSAGIGMFIFITFITPVWIYSSGLAVLLWLTVGALPNLFEKRAIGLTLTFGTISIIALSTLTHNANYLLTLPERASQKAERLSELRNQAQLLIDNGVEVIYGSYYDAIPLGYASAWELRTITNRYNRFPLTDEEGQQDIYRVAVWSQPTEPWGEEAISDLQDECRLQLNLDWITHQEFLIFDCPVYVLSQGG